LNRIERIADPKRVLDDLMVTATEATGRKLKKAKARLRASDVARCIADFSPLRQLTAFCEFERDLRDAVRELEIAPSDR
jgi:hypothetical protein